MMKCGGTSETKPADAQIQELCNQVKSSTFKKLGSDPPQFVAVSCKTQVVAGTNYFVKIKVDGEKHIHVRIFQPLPHTKSGPELHSIQKDKKLEDPIEYF